MGGWMVARDELWEIVEPMVPRVKQVRTGRPRVADRTAFGAIVFVLFPLLPVVALKVVRPSNAPRILSFVVRERRPTLVV
jgi:transposase